MIDFKAYQTECRKTDIYSSSMKLPCLVLGLASEAGEVAGVMKKLYRDAAQGISTSFIKDKIERELGDVMWYVARIIDECGLDFDKVLQQNVEKLHSRQRNDTISGSGDER